MVLAMKLANIITGGSGSCSCSPTQQILLSSYEMFGAPENMFPRPFFEQNATGWLSNISMESATFMGHFQCKIRN